MKMSKKLLLLVSISVTSLLIDAKPGQSGVKNSQEEMLSLEQLQEMQQVEQIATAVTVKMVPKFFAKFPKFRSSAVAAYKKDSELVGKKIIDQAENPSVFEPLFSESITDLKIDKELGAMITELEPLIVELKPLIKQLFVQEIIKWVHITATAGIVIQ